MTHDGDSDNRPKSVRRQQRKQAKEIRQLRRNPKPIEARTTTQKEYICSLHENELTFGVGPAGVGKTYVPARVFGQMISSGDIDKIYLSRPPVAKSRHRMGFLPGTEVEKTAPWIAPIYEGIKDSMSVSDFDRLCREERIHVVPYEFMQGRTFSNAAWIVDEAENLDLDDFYITLTRQGEGLRAAICGDIQQARINNSGLKTVIKMAESQDMEGIGIVRFGEEDVVRSRQARQWVKAFNRIPLSYESNCANDAGEPSFELPEFIRRDN